MRTWCLQKGSRQEWKVASKVGRLCNCTYVNMGLACFCARQGQTSVLLPPGGSSGWMWKSWNCLLYFHRQNPRWMLCTIDMIREKCVEGSVGEADSGCAVMVWGCCDRLILRKCLKVEARLEVWQGKDNCWWTCFNQQNCVFLWRRQDIFPSSLCGNKPGYNKWKHDLSQSL